MTMLVEIDRVLSEAMVTVRRHDPAAGWDAVARQLAWASLTAEASDVEKAEYELRGLRAKIENERRALEALRAEKSDLVADNHKAKRELSDARWNAGRAARAERDNEHLLGRVARAEQENKRLSAEANRLFHAMRRMTQAQIPDELRWKIFRRDGFACRVCGTPRADDDTPSGGLHIDHIQPFSRGGLTHSGNLWTLCAGCNTSKGAKIFDEWVKEKGLEVSA